ncbi:uncharacterized protein LOC116021024 [Ipomoea triloba]|uniref:uncharacterized protein LOC116021024 n=1 Tax=Ipomoea triloba TaxID=35885 RepID=UPI00125D5A39|nr:uncharacterized protein LOC116021024 [Ipomoea triloba]
MSQKMMMSITSVGSSGGRLSMEENEEEEITRMAITSFQAREEEIEKRKMEVKIKVESQLNRAEQQTKHLAHIWEELEVLTDPMRKEVGMVRKKIDTVNRELKSLTQACQKKEKEYKEALEAFQEKNNEKTQLTSTLIEMVNESEKFRLGKLEELSKIVDPTHR